MQKFYSKKFHTIEDQIELLKNRGLSFRNEEEACEVLLQKNYFDVINGFETLLLKDPKAKKKEYGANYYFEHFIELYKFDKLLSSVILQKIEAFENRLKTSIAYRFAEYANNNSSGFKL
ncbi:Abi family protein [Planococcus kocurii]|uniref:Abi family protein n=1 Tax=Planococcus kocurii TaxID=1374 RepID=UPI003D02F8BD